MPPTVTSTLPERGVSSRLRGECWVLSSFDLGMSIDLDRARALLAESTVAGPFRHKRSGPVGRSVRVSLEARPLVLGSFASPSTVAVTLHEFGAATVAWSLPVDASADEAATLAGLLNDNPAVEKSARELVLDVLGRIESAVTRPLLSPISEDYVVFHVREATCGDDEIARILRAEPGELSDQERTSALDAPISYRPNEVCYVDWLGAMLIGEDMEDELRVLELANVTLLELRVLDLELTAVLESSYAVFLRSRVGVAALSGRRREVSRVSRLQADSALLQENVRNAHKLVGDDYLARLYARAARRFRLDDWDTSTTRKLGLLASGVESLTAQASHLRSEILEWIIILLIAVDIVIVLS